MKTFNRILGLGAVASLVFGFASCSNDLNSPEVENPGAEAAPALKMLKTPDAFVWSGKTVLLNARDGETGDILDGVDNDWNVEYTNPYAHSEEVEVNLALLDKKAFTGSNNETIYDLVSKLSIHVRCATDVRIKLPVPAQYIIESDDLYIFHEHYAKNGDDYGEYAGEYGGSKGQLLVQNADQTLEFKVGEKNIVKLHVKFESTPEDEDTEDTEEYFLVWTEGITPEVIKACFDYNEDGLNFEVYNYYQTSKIVWEDNRAVALVTGKLETEDYEAIADALDEATIEFVEPDNAPYYYINAFGDRARYQGKAEDLDGTYRASYENDLEVKPADMTGWTKKDNMFHLNGTSKNVIYSKEGIEVDDVHAHGDGDDCVDGKHKPAV